MIARLVIWALKARAGLAAMVIAANFSGFGVIVTELWLSGSLSMLGDDRLRSVMLAGIYPTLGFLVGVGLALRDRSSHFGWLDQGRRPTESEARQVLRLPIIITVRAFAVWLTGVIVATVTLMYLAPDNDPAVLAALFMLGGFESVGLTFLIVDRLIRPTIPVVAAVLGPTMHWSSTVLVRVVVSWAVAGALPLLMLIVVLANPAAAPTDRIRTGVYLSIVGLTVGAIATAFLARAVASPMRTLRRALDRITKGDLDVRVPVGSTSEIGRLENSVNELAANLSERQRMRDLFGRHVGNEVAERALAGGVDLTGDVRTVTALFVDVTGSVELSTGLPPEQFVAKLNRLLATVVAATEENNGLVNKFEGDAALCIFGAPIDLRDNATPALRAARRIRDEVVAAGELDIGIGVAHGSVFAGNVGSDTRLEYTVIGDAVNEAARLTTEAKEVPRRILVSGAVIESAAAHERAKWVHYETILLRGMQTPTACWTDLDRRTGPGPAGASGSTGSTTAAGSTGSAGPAAATGSTEPTTTTTATDVAGATGSTGPTTATGSAAATGVSGATGSTSAASTAGASPVLDRSGTTNPTTDRSTVTEVHTATTETD